MEQHTIAAIATPPGIGGVAMVRLSGPDAQKLADRVFRGKKEISRLGGYCGCYGAAYDGQGWIDEVVALNYLAPKSYTGEDVVELFCHGGSLVAQRLLRALLDTGAVMAQPGEFTRRAVLNGKLSLSQAEGVADLIGAQTEQQHRLAAQGRLGAQGRAVDAVAASLTEIQSHLAAWIDFPEEDVEQVQTGRLEQNLCAQSEAVGALLVGYDRGQLLKNGVRTVLVGRPNVGKSTLMNLLAGFEKSIVTEIAGTTRDLVEDIVVVGGVTLHLTDTAGVRDTLDPVEREGVSRAMRAAEQSQLAIVILDAAAPFTAHDRALLERQQGRPVIVVVNKTDTASDALLQALCASAAPFAAAVVPLCAQKGEGLDQLCDEIRRVLALTGADENAVFLANERQRQCALRARQALGEAIDALREGVTLDAVSVCIGQALDALYELTGENAPEKVIDEVFSRFCVGK